jgi:hypothetical protein
VFAEASRKAKKLKASIVVGHGSRFSGRNERDITAQAIQLGDWTPSNGQFV